MPLTRSVSVGSLVTRGVRSRRQGSTAAHSPFITQTLTIQSATIIQVSRRAIQTTQASMRPHQTQDSSTMPRSTLLESSSNHNNSRYNKYHSSSLAANSPAHQRITIPRLMKTRLHPRSEQRRSYNSNNRFRH